MSENGRVERVTATADGLQIISYVSFTAGETQATLILEVPAEQSGSAQIRVTLLDSAGFSSELSFNVVILEPDEGNFVFIGAQGFGLNYFSPIY